MFGFDGNDAVIFDEAGKRIAGDVGGGDGVNFDVHRCVALCNLHTAEGGALRSLRPVNSDPEAFLLRDRTSNGGQDDPWITGRGGYWTAPVPRLNTSI